MKPTGLGFKLTENGICFSVNHPSKVEDAVWEAVELAISAGWTPQRMRLEIADAWREKLLDEAKAVFNELSR